jgi:thiaminase
VSVADALERAGAKPAGKRPYFYAQEVERVLAITLSIAQELAVARQRIDTLERLLEAAGVLDRDAIEAFDPTPVQAAERGALNEEYVARIFRVFQQEAEAMQAASANEQSIDEHFEQLRAEQPAL